MFDREGDDGKFVSVTVKATDQGEPSLEGVCSFTVEITDVNDNPPLFDRQVSVKKKFLPQFPFSKASIQRNIVFFLRLYFFLCAYTFYFNKFRRFFPIAFIFQYLLFVKGIDRSKTRLTHFSPLTVVFLFETLSY